VGTPRTVGMEHRIYNLGNLGRILRRGEAAIFRVGI
jgi:hypothetical protein